MEQAYYKKTNAVRPTCVRPLRQSDSWRRETEWWLPAAGGGRDGELVFNGDRVSVWKDGKVLEMAVVTDAQQCAGS